MKKTMIMIAAIIAMSFAAGPKTERLLKVEMSQAQWGYHFKSMQEIRGYIENTNLPHKEVLAIEKGIDSLLLDLSKQLVPQIDSTKKKK